MIALFKAVLETCFTGSNQKEEKLPPQQSPPQEPPLKELLYKQDAGGWYAPGQYQQGYPTLVQPLSWVQAAGQQKNENQSGYYQVPPQHRQEFQKPPTEQQYAPTEGAHLIAAQPSKAELEDYTLACSRLWELDTNRCVPGQDYEIDCQEGKKVYSPDDVAPQALFRFVNQAVFHRPTIARFFALLDNYTADEVQPDVQSAANLAEQRSFVEEISRTAPVLYLHQYLAQKKFVSPDVTTFKKELHSLWFQSYGRGGGRQSSSAFEHVFIGEVKDEGPGQQGEGEKGGRRISGFHNWLQFYLEESRGNLNYRGFIFPRQRAAGLPDSHSQVLTLQFSWHGLMKDISSSFIGVSPEFELALYTLCFFVGGEDNRVRLGPYEVNVKVYHLGENRIGSAFPIVES